MTAEFWAAVGLAGWLGILTAISPCPLATNIAAISYIGRRVANPRAALVTGLLYTLGRTIIYVVIAAILVASLLSSPAVSGPLMKYMNKVLGPILILLGMMLLGLIQFNTGGSGLSEKLGRRVADWGVWGGLALGVIFALAFCPASAGIYFAGLVPLAIQYESSLVIPLVFGVGTALPVVVFAILIVVSANAMAKAFDKISAFERWARRVTGALFIAIGIFFCLAFIFEVIPATLS